MTEDPLYVGTVLLTRRKHFEHLGVVGWVTMMFSTDTLLSTQQMSCQKEPALPSKPQKSARLGWDISFILNQKKKPMTKLFW